jgi:hypothetical protein
MCAKGPTLRVLLLVAFVIYAPPNILAQEDTTPPVLLGFAISPVLFDTSEADVTIYFCVTAADDLSGTGDVSVRADDPASSPLEGIIGISLNFQGATSPTEKCASVSVPIGSPHMEYLVEISLKDRVGNRRVVKHPLHPCTGLAGCESAEDLCDAGFVCSIENRVLSPLPDADGDGVSDISDNCPDDFNPNQEDSDLDLLGDACDPFPDYRDNEKAQCQADLASCLENPIFSDEDDDGEADFTDRCPGTPSEADVDSNGCSLSQYCSGIDAGTPNGRKVCNRSDWKNDEPLGNKGDCEAIKVGMGSSNYSCVPRQY